MPRFMDEVAELTTEGRPLDLSHLVSLSFDRGAKFRNTMELARLRQLKCAFEGPLNVVHEASIWVFAARRHRALNQYALTGAVGYSGTTCRRKVLGLRIGSSRFCDATYGLSRG